MGWEKGNKYWQLAQNPGRKKKYTPKSFFKKFLEFTKWIDENPFYEAVLVQKGITTKDENGKEETVYHTSMPKMRPYTLTGFFIFANITQKTWDNYCKQDEFFQVVTRIKDICFSQKFEGAASGFFNSNIIARDLGLVDKSKTEVTINPFLDLMKRASEKKKK